ncbi:MAG TPA: metallophosphoesterase [Gemmatimonadaceae bacterium]|nr:metallophosphoesterase [Gemmatimonadaceae bacterium]
MSDIHCGKESVGSLQGVFAQAAEQADVLVLCGDLTDYGLPEEARVLAKELATVNRMPIVGVLGNHDYESGKQDEICAILSDAGMKVLDGDSFETHGVGFAGVKGFAGGFGRGALGPWGEPIIKQFVHEAVNESLKLETARARLRSQHRIAVLHYSPVRQTVEGEPPEIFPYLGCSRLEEPLQRYDVFAVVHGHAHNGSLEGATARGVPVYNVAMPLMRKRFPERPPFRVIEIPLGLPDRRGAADGAGGEHAAYDEGPPPSPVPPPVETTVGR